MDSSIKYLTLIIFSAFILSDSLIFAENKRPFWTEKTAFIQGKDLLVVGVASHAKAEEEGRQKAFENGKIELMNYAQITDLEAQGLVIETQMTYEEPNQDGTVTVFRLLQVPVDKLLVIQGRVKAQGEAHAQEIKQLQSELLAKQKNLEVQSYLVDQRLKDITGLQNSLSERAKQLEVQQKKIQVLLSQFTAKSSGKMPSSSSKFPNSNTGSASLENLEGQVKAVEEKMNEREQAILKIQQKAVERIERNTKLPCRFVKKGMTQDEVKSMLGEPDGSKLGNSGVIWTYGRSDVYFDYADIVYSVYSGHKIRCSDQ